MSETPTDADRDREARTTDTDRDRRTRDEYDAGAMKWLSALVSLVGLWIAASPFVYDATEMALWNNVVVGLAIFLIAGYNYYRMSNGRVASTGSASLVALLGLWTLIAPFAIEFGNEAMLWSNVVSGLIVAGIGAYNAYASSRTPTAPRGTRA